MSLNDKASDASAGATEEPHHEIWQSEASAKQARALEVLRQAIWRAGAEALARGAEPGALAEYLDQRAAMLLEEVLRPPGSDVPIGEDRDQSLGEAG